MVRFQIKRIYEAPAETDGYRVLIDRLWPRGLRKDVVKIDEWNKELAPSTDLRKWFNHQSARFEAFAIQYQKELSAKAVAIRHLRELAEKGPVTLLYGAKDKQNNNAVILKRVLESHRL